MLVWNDSCDDTDNLECFWEDENTNVSLLQSSSESPSESPNESPNDYYKNTQTEIKILKHKYYNNYSEYKIDYGKKIKICG